MKRLSFMVALCVAILLAGCKGKQQEDTAPDDEGTAQQTTQKGRHDAASKAPNRKDYHFTAEFTPAGSRPTHIIVRGFVGDDEETPYFEEQVQLAVPPGSASASADSWVDDRTDINFDGIPDLVVYLGSTTYSFEVEYYDAYVWNAKKRSFVHVDGYSEIENPKLDRKSKTISGIARTGSSLVSTRTYAWRGGQLKLIKEEAEDDGNDVAEAEDADEEEAEE